MGAKFTKKQEDFLRDVRFAKLATLNKDGSPQLTPVWFTLDDGRLIVNTARGRQKYVNMKRDARVALLVDDGYRYVSVAGTVREATERDAHGDIEALAIKYWGEERGRKSAREQFGREPRVSFEIVPKRIIADL
jgi:PPOX class probable F420-dependent enzyme